LQGEGLEGLGEPDGHAAEPDDGTGALTDLRVAVRMDDRAQVRKALAEVGKSRKTFNDLQQELQ
jgi:hypothetical protein